MPGFLVWLKLVLTSFRKQALTTTWTCLAVSHFNTSAFQWLNKIDILKKGLNKDRDPYKKALTKRIGNPLNMIEMIETNRKNKIIGIP